MEIDSPLFATFLAGPPPEPPPSRPVPSPWTPPGCPPLPPGVVPRFEGGGICWQKSEAKPEEAAEQTWPGAKSLGHIRWAKQCLANIAKGLRSATPDTLAQLQAIADMDPTGLPERLPKKPEPRKKSKGYQETAPLGPLLTDREIRTMIKEPPWWRPYINPAGQRYLEKRGI